MTRLIVENVHRMSSRPWAFVTGRLEGDSLRVGDELVDGRSIAVVVRSVELHSAPATTTVAVEGVSADTIRAGTVLTRE